MSTKQKETTKPTLLGRFSLLFVKRYWLTIALWVTVLGFGIFSYASLLEREGFPPVQVPVAVVSGTYFVDNAEKVDQEVSIPVTDALLGIGDVEGVQTTSRENFFSAVVSFNEEISSQQGADLARAKIENSVSLPKGVELEYQVIDAAKFDNEYDALLALYSTEGASARQLQDESVVVVERLRGTESIGKVATLDLFSEGVNPVTGQSVVNQMSYSRFGIREEGENQADFFNTILIGVSRDQNDETTDVIELNRIIEGRLEQINQELSGTEYQVVVAADFASQVTTQIDGLQSNLLTGLIAVSIVTFILISWRASLISAVFMVSVIVSIMGLLQLIGYSLNTITLFALVLTLGLFIDDATVILEAIDANRRKAKKATEVVAIAMRRVAAASAAGTMTTVLVFAPILFVSGVLGEFIRVLPATVIVSLLLSLLLSFILIPFMASGLLLRGRMGKKNEKERNPVLILERWLADNLAKLPRTFNSSKLKGALVATAGFLLSFVFIGASFWYASQLKFNIFPPSKDSDAIAVNVSFNPGTTIDQAEVAADEIDTRVASVVGPNLERAAFAIANERNAMIQLTLVSYQDREITAPQILEDLEAEFSDYSKASITVNQLDAGPPAAEFPFTMQVFGDDPESAIALAEEVGQFLESTALERENGTTFSVAETKINNTQAIVRTDGRRFVELAASFNADDVSALVVAAQEAVEERYPASELTSRGFDEDALGFDFGQESENAESFAALGFAFLVALGSMFLLLAIQFRSIVQPLLIFTAIPFSLLGVFAGLHYTDNPLSFFAMIGLIGLIGIVVNNTILLTDYANQERRAGSSPVDAIAESVDSRFRPLLVTTLTTIAGLLPLALTDPFWEPLAFTIIFGLLSSTVLVLVSFPYYYLVLEWLRGLVKRGFKAGLRKVRKTT